MAGSDDEAMAYGSEPFYGFDGSLYMVYGAREPGDVRVVQLNESNGRLQIAQPGESNVSLSPYHTVARGPSFELTSDSHSTTNFVQHTSVAKFVPCRTLSRWRATHSSSPLNVTERSSTFCLWSGLGTEIAGDSNESLSRIYVGRSEESPLGPFKDRIGNRLDIRSRPSLAMSVPLVSSLRHGAQIAMVLVTMSQRLQNSNAKPSRHATGHSPMES